MNETLATANSPISKTHPMQVVTTNPNPIEPPSAWMQYGTSPTGIILAIAIVIAANAFMIGSITFLVKVLVPVMRVNSSHKRK